MWLHVTHSIAFITMKRRLGIVKTLQRREEIKNWQAVLFVNNLQVERLTSLMTGLFSRLDIKTSLNVKTVLMKDGLTCMLVKQ